MWTTGVASISCVQKFSIIIILFKINKGLELGVIYFNRVKLKVTDTIIPVTFQDKEV